MIKRAVIINATTGDRDLDHERYQKAIRYLEDRGYEVLSFSADDEIEKMTQFGLDARFNAGLYIVGTTSTLMSHADLVYFCDGSDQTEYGKDLQLLAFKYGLEIVTESKE